MARRAPSPHNTQPWRIDTDGAAGRLYLDVGRALPDEDVTGSFVVAALGIFVETAGIAAASRGRRLVVAPADLETVREAARGHGTGLVHAADLTLGPGSGAAPDGTDGDPSGFGDDLILARRTSRLAPAPTPLPAEAIAEVTAEARRGGQTVHLIDDRRLIDEIMQVNLDGVIEDLSSPEYHDEIVRWFRYSRDQELRTRDGLSARCMAMPGYEMAFLARFPGAARLPFVGPLVRALYRRRIGPVPRLLALAGPFWTGPAAFDAGRTLMRCWLALTRHGISIHPFGNLITNAGAAGALRRLTGIEDPWIVMRAGFTAVPPRSLRRELGEIAGGTPASGEGRG